MINIINYFHKILNNKSIVFTLGKQNFREKKKKIIAISRSKKLACILISIDIQTTLKVKPSYSKNLLFYKTLKNTNWVYFFISINMKHKTMFNYSASLNRLSKVCMLVKLTKHFNCKILNYKLLITPT